MPRRRPFIVAFVACAAALALTSCSSSPSNRGAQGGRHDSGRVITSPSISGGGAATTREVVFTPYSSQGTVLATIEITQTVTGTCVSPGVAGASSYRCFAQPGSTVYDPCFAPPNATNGPLVCVADPAQPEAVSFDVGPLPTSPTAGPMTQPWAMQLSNGQDCIFVSAAWGTGLGPFACPTAARSSPSEADCHMPRKNGLGYDAACQAREASTSTFRPVQVVKVWT